MDTTLLPCISCARERDIERLGERSVLRQHGVLGQRATRFTEVTGRCTTCSTNLLWYEPLAMTLDEAGVLQALG